MSNRYNSLTVVLEKDMKMEDLDPIIDAIKMVKGVIQVSPLVADAESFLAKEKARYELINEIRAILNA